MRLLQVVLFRKPFIASILKEIAEAEKEEEEKEEKLIQAALKQQDFVRRFGHAYFYGAVADFAGKWQHGTGQFEIKQISGSISGHKKTAIQTMEFAGNVVNSAATIKMRSKSELFGSWEDDGIGLMFLEGDGQIHFMRGLDAAHETEDLEANCG